jgi:Na+/H+ antiporter NhaD/arsenite permease-like protein
MIPLVKDMGAMGYANLEPLWWSLSLGACLGGNGTVIGASANVVALGLARQHKLRVSFMQYFAVGFPLMLLSIVISSVYIWLRFL